MPAISKRSNLQMQTKLLAAVLSLCVYEQSQSSTYASCTNCLFTLQRTGQTALKPLGCTNQSTFGLPMHMFQVEIEFVPTALLLLLFCKTTYSCIAVAVIDMTFGTLCM